MLRTLFNAFQFLFESLNCFLPVCSTSQHTSTPSEFSPPAPLTRTHPPIHLTPIQFPNQPLIRFHRAISYTRTLCPSPVLCFPVRIDRSEALCVSLFSLFFALTPPFSSAFFFQSSSVANNHVCVSCCVLFCFGVVSRENSVASSLVAHPLPEHDPPDPIPTPIPNLDPPSLPPPPLLPVSRCISLSVPLPASHTDLHFNLWVFVDAGRGSSVCLACFSPCCTLFV